MTSGSLTFPNRSTSWLRLFSEVKYQWTNLWTFKTRKSIAYLLVYPHWSSAIIQILFSLFNPNNLGNWTVEDKSKRSGTRKIEHELIKEMAHLYGDRTLAGYVSSGGTEGNIFMAWMGRKKLVQQGCRPHKLALIGSSLSHYSVTKASDVVAVPFLTAPLDSQTFGIDPEGLETMIQKNRRHYDGFLICLTHGYTLTGTNDDVEQITKKLQQMEKKYQTTFFVWIDAALNGLISPFLHQWHPFKNRFVNGIIVDFHKFFGCHYPAGLILYRPILNSLVTQNIDYLYEQDVTLLGSRPGIPALSAWFYIHYFGAQQIRHRIENLFKLKQLWLTRLSQLPGVRVIDAAQSLQAGLIVTNPQTIGYLKQTYDIVIKSVSLFTTQGRITRKMGKVFFLDEKIKPE